MAERLCGGEGTDLKRGIPDRGDILYLDLEPVKGREQQGDRPVLVLSVAEFNRFGLLLCCPISQGGGFARKHGFAVSLTGSSGKVQGVVLCHQARTVDYKEPTARWVESAPQEITEEVLARVRTLLD